MAAVAVVLYHQREPKRFVRNPCQKGLLNSLVVQVQPVFRNPIGGWNESWWVYDEDDDDDDGVSSKPYPALDPRIYGAARRNQSGVPVVSSENRRVKRETVEREKETTAGPGSGPVTSLLVDRLFFQGARRPMIARRNCRRTAWLKNLRGINQVMTITHIIFIQTLSCGESSTCGFGL